MILSTRSSSSTRAGVTALVCSAFLAAPGLASAATITVDDDRAQCPLADYGTVTAGVAAAAQGDTVYLCPGTYAVPGGAGSGGLKIEKNLSLVGAGADQVFIQPDGTSPTMIGATPNERDEFGNVITVKRRLIQLFHITISGLTVRAAGTAVEGGIAMIDVTEGLISGVKVEGLVPDTGAGTGLYSSAPGSEVGDGVIIANTTEAVQNEVEVSGSQITGFNKSGVLIDNRLTNGAGNVGNNSSMIARIHDTAITGGGLDSNIDQNGIEVWGSGSELHLADSTISGVGDDNASEAAIYLRGGKVLPSLVGGSPGDANDLSGNFFGIASYLLDGSALAPDVLNATRNFFGPVGPGLGAFVATSNVDWTPAVGSAPPAPVMDEVQDDLPEIEWDVSPDPGEVFDAGVTVPLAVVAGDDFGVNNVEFFADGESLGTAPTPALNDERVYPGSWSPTTDDAGKSIVLSALATDSSGQTAEATVTVEVAPLAETSIDGGPAEGSASRETIAAFTYSSSKPGSTFDCSLDGAPSTPCPGGSLTTSVLPDGTHTFEVFATDPAGNADPTPAKRTFTVDTTAPETEITSGPTAADKKAHRAVFGFQANESGANFECSMDAAAFTLCSPPKSCTHLTRGKHVFLVRAVDRVGNTDATEAVAKFKIKKRKKPSGGGSAGGGAGGGTGTGEPTC